MKGYLLLMVFVLGSLLPAAAQGQNRTITGRVTGENKSALSGVSVQVKGNTSIGVSTGADGRYSLSVPVNATALTFSFLGYETREINLRPGSTTYNAMMTQAVISMGPAVVQAGIMTREAATYTGSQTTVSQAQLKETGVTNVLSALSAIDPAFMLVDNNLAGSNPNGLPSFELNGKTGMSITSLTDEYSVNPNLPLFVVDGFESTLEKVNDLDVNRIASMTTLKDAGSTAIYGSKGANGVVVIETVKPKPGELMINYNGYAELSFADLSGYNLMNSREKLEFERLTGAYTSEGAGGGHQFDNPLNATPYYKKLEAIERGVDTYWLKYPLRSGISHSHNLSVSGGDNKFTYMGTLNYMNDQGVMKGSVRENVGGNIFLQYRVNNLNVSNDMHFGTTNSHDGSYGKFSTWVNMNPYYRPYDDNGRLVQNVNSYAGLAGGGDYVANPLYNASLNSDNISKKIDFTNNTKLEWRLTQLGLRITGGLSLQRTSSTLESYKDANHTDYREEASYLTKGRFTYSTSNGWNWDGNMAAQWNKTIADNHNFIVMARASANSESGKTSGYTVEGTVQNAAPNPSQASDYLVNSLPPYNLTHKRAVTFMGTFNYNYASRYMLDFTYNRNGSSAFGRKNPFTNNWSVGAGWNISREKFMESVMWVSNLKLRASYGLSSNQSNSALAYNVYSVMNGQDYFGQSWYLSGISNPWLDWQNTTQLNAGIDAAFLDDRLMLTFDVFNKKTDPTVNSIPYPPSTGLENYLVNLGYLTSKGYTASVNYIIMRNPANRMLWSVRLSAGHNKQQYGGFGAAFEQLSKNLAEATNAKDSDGRPDVAKVQEVLNNNKSLVRYKDGSDPDALWAMRSGGIDPATGREILYDKNGKQTFTYNYDDEVVVGTTRAKVYGNIGMTFNYKHFRSSLNMSYSLGGYAMNTALFTKVENITAQSVFSNNQDKRALYDRWQKPGDQSEFLSLKRVTSIGKPSSRFVQKNNYLQASAISVGWDFYDGRLLERIGMRSLVATITMNDLFRISSIKQERGIDYPFARAIRLTLSTSF